MLALHLMNKTRDKRNIRITDIVGLGLLAFVAACRLWTPVADYYAERLFPAVSAGLSWPASLVPFPLEELVVTAFFVGLLAVLVRAVRRKEGFLRWLGRSARLVMWLLVWFYLGWGCNYFRTPLYARLGVKPAHFELEAFRQFLSEYTGILDGAAGSPVEWEPSAVEQAVKDFYAERGAACGYTPLRCWQHVKQPLLNPLYSAVSVMGWLGPFFCEAQVNRDVPRTQYPSTMAHELAHLSGVTGEGEANYWAYAFCRQSNIPAVRYSGCLSILPYVAQNARALLPEEEYRSWMERVPQRAKDDTAANRQFWESKRIPLIERVQRWIMDLFLKSNGVSAGKRDYSGVVGIIMTMDGAHLLVARREPGEQ